jgi:large subunit ribosomal protein L24
MKTNKIKIKKGDRVIVRTGRNKGEVSTVLRVLKEKNSLILENVNLVVKHVKPTELNPGRMIRKESKIHVSNVAILDPKLLVPSKIGFKLDKNGTKVRIAKKSGEPI